MTRACVFCGNSPTTREHIISEWAGEILLQGKPAPSKPGNVVKARHQRFREDAGVRTALSEWITSDAPEFTAKCVCGECNGGWMSNIESAAIPIMTPMIQGEAVQLDRNAQDIVARWLGLKAIVQDFSHAEAARDQEWIAYYFKHRQPPMTWHIRLGRYDGERQAFFGGGALDASIRHALSPFTWNRPGLIFTISIGHFVGQVIGVKQQAAVSLNPRYFAQIWPHPLIRAETPRRPHYQAEPWPPERGLDDSQLQKCVRDPAEPKD